MDARARTAIQRRNWRNWFFVNQCETEDASRRANARTQFMMQIGEGRLVAFLKQQHRPEIRLFCQRRVRARILHAFPVWAADLTCLGLVVALSVFRHRSSCPYSADRTPKRLNANMHNANTLHDVARSHKSSKKWPLCCDFRIENRRCAGYVFYLLYIVKHHH